MLWSVKRCERGNCWNRLLLPEANSKQTCRMCVSVTTICLFLTNLFQRLLALRRWCNCSSCAGKQGLKLQRIHVCFDDYNSTILHAFFDGTSKYETIALRDDIVHRQARNSRSRIKTARCLLCLPLRKTGLWGGAVCRNGDGISPPMDTISALISM